MTRLATRSEKLSNVLAWELAPETGFCRSMVTVTVEAGMDVGAVVVLNAGKYKWVAAADVASLAGDVRIVIDPSVAGKAAGDATLAVLGSEAAFTPAQVNRKGLKFKDALSEAQIDAVVAKLNARGIRTKTRV